MEAPKTISPSCETCPIHRAGFLEKFGVDMQEWDYVVALAGNPNTGKSTVFNRLTGLRQHTGNWPGKTVTRAEGGFSYRDTRFKLIDLPGTYSLLSTSSDEEIARNFIVFGRPDVVVAVVDATHLQRNLNLVLQMLEISGRVVVCLNLMDEARRQKLTIDVRGLSRELGVPVIPTAARSGEGLDRLLQAIHEVATSGTEQSRYRITPEPVEVSRAVQRLIRRLELDVPDLPNPRWVALRLLDGDERIAEALRNGELSSSFPQKSKTRRSFEWIRSGEGRESSENPSFTQVTPAKVKGPPRFRSRLGETGRPAVGFQNGRRLDSRIRGSDRPIDAVLSEADRIRRSLSQEFHDQYMEAVYADAARIADKVTSGPDERQRFRLDRAIDRIVTSRVWGLPFMLLLFTVVFWITVSGANVPSGWLAALLIDGLYPRLHQAADLIGFPTWLSGLTIDGMYLATAWVVSVMLPPMAIFFPMFTLLEDFGYLPRVAFNLDHLFKKSGAHGKQALSMMMGFGCNAAGVIATRVIDSPRERLIAIITNNFALCNGRWPTQIIVAVVFIGALVPGYLAGPVAAMSVVGVAVLGVILTFLVSALLSKTVLRGEASTFSLELPSYRPPRILQTIYTSLIDRTIFVLWRAVMFALPAGAVIWLSANIKLGGVSIAEHLIAGLDPIGLLIGLNGIILLAYLVAIPANEIVIPTVLMLTVLVAGLDGFGAGSGVMFEPETDAQFRELLEAGGWTLLTAVNLMLFSLVHNPCSTTIFTIYKETGSLKWTAVASLLPLLLGLALTFFVAQGWRLVEGLAW